MINYDENNDNDDVDDDDDDDDDDVLSKQYLCRIEIAEASLD